MIGKIATWTPGKIAASLAYLLLLALATTIMSPPLENIVRDAMTALVSPFTQPRPGIVVVAFDEASLAAFPYRSPIDRGFLATLVKRIDAASPRAIGIDLLFDQPTEPAKDAELVAAIAAAKAPVIVASGSAIDGLGEKQVAFLDLFAPTAIRGLAALSHDNLDGVVRSVFPGRRIDGSWHPSFAAAIGSAGGVEGSRTVEDMVYYRSANGTPYKFPVYPARAVQLAPPGWFEGKYVLLGTDLPQDDRHATPFALIAGPKVGTLPGVVIHAHSLARLLSGDRIVRPGLAAGLAIFLVAGSLCAWISWRPIPLGLKPLAVVAILLVLWMVEVLAFARYAILLPMVEPALLVIGLSALVAFFAWLRDAEQRRYIQMAFSQYVSPAVVATIVKQPSALALGGERRIITSIFTDLEGFTEFSEKLEPEQLATILNGYLDGVCNTFFEHGATVDKVVGDAVVGFFGAPIAQEDQGTRALALILAIEEFSRQLGARMAADGIVLGRTRVGAHSGPAIVGNFGGHRFFDYTAIGDTVNTAARLEGANKSVGTNNCISWAVAKQTTGFLLRPVGALYLKGRTESIETFEVMSATPGNATMCEEYSKAYALLAGRQENAGPAFECLRQKYPDDGLIGFHRNRLARGVFGADVHLSEK